MPLVLDLVIAMVLGRKSLINVLLVVIIVQKLIQAGEAEMVTMALNLLVYTNGYGNQMVTLTGTLVQVVDLGLTVLIITILMMKHLSLQLVIQVLNIISTFLYCYHWTLDQNLVLEILETTQILTSHQVLDINFNQLKYNI